MSPRTRVGACLTDEIPERCLGRVYAGAVERGEVAETLVALGDHSRRGRLDDCHLEAHRLAHAVYRVVGDVERAFLLGGPQCRNGYLHGAVEASGGLTVPRCGRFRFESQRSACAHGYGHALMLRNRHDILASTDGCRTAARRGLAREACELGVMMQNSLRYAGRRDFALLSAGECNAARSERLGRLCYENVGVVAALSHGHDRARAAAECARLGAGDQRHACLEGARTEIAEATRGG